LNKHVIFYLLEGENPKDYNIDLISNNFTASEDPIEYINELKTIIDICNYLGIEYYLIKCYEISYIYMSDVDLVIFNTDDIIKLVSYLKKLNYKIFYDRSSLNKYKFTLINSTRDINIDIYPDACWNNLRYLHEKNFLKNKINKKVWGVDVISITKSLDFYVIMTHSYSHGRIKLSEIEYLIKLILNNDINYSYISKLVSLYGNKHIYVLYLNLIKKISCDEHIINNNGNINNCFMYKIYSLWINKIDISNFPIKIPIIFRLVFSIYRIFKGNNGLYKPYGELTGYIMSFIYRGSMNRLYVGDKINEYYDDNTRSK